jgi:hypothetical protein
MGRREKNEVRIPPIKSPACYAVALHEIGHVKGRFQLSKKLMVREQWAWRWARDNSLTWTAAMEREWQACLRRYENQKRFGGWYYRLFCRGVRPNSRMWRRLSSPSTPLEAIDIIMKRFHAERRAPNPAEVNEIIAKTKARRGKMNVS